MSSTEIGLQAVFILLSSILALLGPAMFFCGHDPLYLFTAPFAFRWHICLLSFAGGLVYTIVLSMCRKALEGHEQRQIKAM